MARILITSGPTRQYLDPVRYLSNASSGQMGSCLAQAAIDLGHEVTIVSGPVSVEYPDKATVIQVISTEEMLDAATQAFKNSDGCIAAAAPCDYKPATFSKQKIKKSAHSGIELKLVETPDVIGSLGKNKATNQWCVCFALETEDGHNRALKKVNSKNCDLVVLNGASAINSTENKVEIISAAGETVQESAGPKLSVAKDILKVIQEVLID